MAITLQFVEKIDAVPTVRLDLAASPWSLLRKPDFSPPPLRRAVVSTLLRDGAEIPASAYDNRVLRLPLRVQAATEDLLATELTKLNRELDRSRNVLKWSSGGTAPVFFRTLRSPDYGLELRIVGTGEALIDLPVQAEPFAYGLKVELAAVAVNNDPAAASNGKFFEVSGVPGDVPTPALIFRSPITTQMTFAVRRHGTPADMTWFQQAEALTAGTDTSVQPNSPAFSGAGSNFMRTTFATNAGLIDRLTGTLPKTGAAIPTAAEAKAWKGLYRLFVRVRTEGTNETYKVRMVYGGIAGETVTVGGQGSTGKDWLVDLGVLSIPIGPAPETVGYGDDLGAAVILIALQAQRVAGTGSLAWDYVLLLPADEEVVLVDGVDIGDRLYLDGPNDAVYLAIASPLALQSPTAAFVMPHIGTIPLLAPNQVNRIFFLQQVHPDIDAGMGASSVITVAYWPRFLYIR